ncbi:MAG: glucose-1-phosphate adenylyltransferase [Thermodesulfovibrionales bacterium]|nr:glucose-1-phosphate adenylyltransferase [Thermodesulfovibrionales bacterium]
MHPKVLAFVLAGGKGERLFPLTTMRSKPSVPFGGRYRIVDFVLSNLVNSHIYSIYLLVQYKSQSLIEHVRQNWVLPPLVKDHFIALVPPQMRMGPEWFQGTADAVLQNVNLILQQDPELVIVFGADHIYRMDIRQMIDFHIERKADVTIAARPVPLKEASAFGVIAIDGENRIIEFQEKPKRPSPMPTNPKRAYVSMGNYIFSKGVLVNALARAQGKKQHDFGAHILPGLVDTGKLFAYDFATNIVPGVMPYEEAGYWRDVGTIDAFFRAHMDMLGAEPVFELNNRQWPILSGSYGGPSAKILRGDIKNSMVAEGCVIHRAKIRNSVIRPNVVVEDGVSIEDSIVMDGVVLKKNCRLKRVIIDKLNIIGEGEEIGFDPARDRFRCHIDASGIAILPRGGRKMRAKESF